MSPSTARSRVLRPGTATAVGSLPHTDAAEAARFILELHPHLPSAPELPARAEAEGMVARWLAGDAPRIADDTHAGWIAFAEAATQVKAVKSQVAGPLTFGMAFLASGMAPGEAFARGAAVSAAAVRATVEFMAERLPHADQVVFLDEPALVAWNDPDPPLGREEAVDLISSVLAHIPAVTGVHVCGQGDRRMAIEAGPDIVGFPIDDTVMDDGVALARYLDAGGWIAWGAVPTDRPVGEQADHWWNGLVSLWCELTRGGCDPVSLRAQALITPACGLAAHSSDQAARILRHCVEIGERAREQAIATRLSVGA